MKILFLNSTDKGGGAANAAKRLCKGLQNSGVETQMLVQCKTEDVSGIIGPQSFRQKLLSYLNPFIDNLPVRFCRKHPLHNFSTGLLPDALGKKVESLAPDIVHLHWVGQGFAGITSLRYFKRPIVWTLHDFWPFTGGCHYPDGCCRYMETCGQCPVLGSEISYDLSRLILWRKKSNWRHLDFTLVAPSRWIGDCARRSSMFKDTRIDVIPNGLDLSTYKPLGKEFARELLGLPKNKKLILFGAKRADEPRKGFNLLVDALLKFDKSLVKNCELVLFGVAKHDSFPDLGLKINYMGSLHDEISLATLYAAVDVFIAPSLEENLANTVMEALACGTPCVAFNVGGMPDMVDHQRNGYLAKPFNHEDLAEGIKWTLGDEERHTYLSKEARKKTEQNFSIEKVSQRYMALYHEIIS